MNLKQLLKRAGVSNNIIAEVERKAKQTSADQELEHQEKAMAMTKMMLNDVLKQRKEYEQQKQSVKEPRKIIVDGD